MLSFRGEIKEGLSESYSSPYDTAPEGDWQVNVVKGSSLDKAIEILVTLEMEVSPSTLA